MFKLDVRSRKPIYEQLMDTIKESIVYGSLSPDEQLPSVRTLSSQLTVNPNTIQKAYRELEREGYIYSIQGKGSFVTSAKDHLNTGIREEIRGAFIKLIAEAAYMGLTREELTTLFEEALSYSEEGRKEITHD